MIKETICLIVSAMILMSALISCGSKGVTESGDPDTPEPQTDETISDPIPQTVEDCLFLSPAVRSVDLTDEIQTESCFVQVYDLVLSAEAGDLQIMLELPDTYQEKKLAAILWLPDAVIDSTRFLWPAVNGYAVFTLYYRGYQDTQSTGEMDFGGDCDLNDLTAILDVIRECGFVNRDRIFAVGASVWESIGLQRLLTENEASGIRAAALPNPITDMRALYDWSTAGNEGWREFFRRTIGGSPEEVPEEYDKRSSKLHMDRFSVPLLIAYFSSETDELLPRSLSEGFVEDLRNAGKDVSLVEFDFPGTDFISGTSVRYLISWFDSFS